MLPAPRTGRSTLRVRWMPRGLSRRHEGMNSYMKHLRDHICIVDAEARSAEYPDTFRIASRATRERLRSGDFAKLIFELDEVGMEMAERMGEEHDGERMWVWVLEDYNGQCYLGTLDNRPSDMPLELGELISFRPEHVCDIRWADEDERE